MYLSQLMDDLLFLEQEQIFVQNFKISFESFLNGNFLFSRTDPFKFGSLMNRV